MWAVSDDTLLAGLAAGDGDAASAFVARFQRRLFGLALAMTGDARTAEEVAQEAFVRAWRHAPAYDPRRGSVVTWLLAITRNLAIDALRVRRPVVLEPEVLLGMSPIDDAVGPADQVAAGEDGARLRTALARLPEEQRRAVVLAGMYGFSAREISEVEGIPLGTAKTRIRTALIRLRNLLVTEERAE
jgi:RNA polymerase sigma-70 factor (ECF subfamily)